MRKRRRVWKPTQVTVEWIDACVRVEVHGTLSAVLEKAKLARRQSQGWLIRYDQYLTVIARDYDPPDELGTEPEVGDVQIMPSGWVLAVRSGGRLIQREQREQADASHGSTVPGQDAPSEGTAGSGAADAGNPTVPSRVGNLRAPAP